MFSAVPPELPCEYELRQLWIRIYPYNDDAVLIRKKNLKNCGKSILITANRFIIDIEDNLY